ncbi:IS3 family transposase [Achromobacter sp. F4_2707]|uniref:IS3 family transposase n=1 Tax=Achromobacter sp. F4_2707 TaxID=3114286 RepID=UPI0039C6CA72
MRSPGRHDELKAKIQAVYAEHRGLYGYRRITATIRRDGHLVNHKAVQRLMSEMGMKSRVRAKKFRSYRGELGEAAPNSLNREFAASQANQKWVTDVTEFAVAGKKLYLSPVMDLYNGEIVAYQTSNRPDFSLVINMLKKAAGKCTGTDGPLLHSVRGAQYVSIRYSDRLSEAGINPSVGSTGSAYDNALAETINGLYKTEVIHRRAPWKTKAAVELATLEWVSWFNHQRLLESIGDIPPAEAEERYYRQLAAPAAEPVLL